MNSRDDAVAGNGRQKAHAAQVDPQNRDARLAHQRNGIEQGAVATDGKQKIGFSLQLFMGFKKTGALRNTYLCFYLFIKGP